MYIRIMPKYKKTMDIEKVFLTLDKSFFIQKHLDFHFCFENSPCSVLLPSKQNVLLSK